MSRKPTADTTKSPSATQPAQHSHKDRLLLISQISSWMRDRKEILDEGDNNAIDPNVLRGFDVLRKEGQVDVLVGLIQIFVANTPRRIAEISRASKVGDRNKVRFEAHAQKSSSASIGATALHRICELLETETDTLSIVELEACASKLEYEFKRLEEILRKHGLITGTIIEE